MSDNANMKGERWQVALSVLRRPPGQVQKKDPAVFVHCPPHPPLLVAHSLISIQVQKVLIATPSLLTDAFGPSGEVEWCPCSGGIADVVHGAARIPQRTGEVAVAGELGARAHAGGYAQGIVGRAVDTGRHRLAALAGGAVGQILVSAAV